MRRAQHDRLPYATDSATFRRPSLRNGHRKYHARELRRGIWLARDENDSFGFPPHPGGLMECASCNPPNPQPARVVAFRTRGPRDLANREGVWLANRRPAAPGDPRRVLQTNVPVFVALVLVLRLIAECAPIGQYHLIQTLSRLGWPQTDSPPSRRPPPAGVAQARPLGSRNW